MERFGTLLEAAEFAATLCRNWSFADSDERFDVKGLLILAETCDSEDHIDEDSFYVVSPAGAIGHACTARVLTGCLYPIMSRMRIYPEYREDLQAIRFCPNCGSPTVPGARFCGNCGEKLC
jgi:hypothetical protein